MAGNATEERDFARLVLLACHDLRTPLATVHGFAQTLVRTSELEEPTGRYLEMIDTASRQIADLVDELALGARIEAGRYEPVRKEVDTLELVRAAADRLGEERVEVDGDGTQVELDADATKRAVAALARCALRHGGLERVRLSARGTSLELWQVTPASAPVLLGEDLRDLGAAVAVRLLRAQGGSVELDDETLRIGLA
ncbi:MAG TPA: histidine kinase dimerization/phospho-acceptor domain-containing protein [Gaiellaceae bacterium]|nr:histidine kinase dimerization/phospho-acceptor domain-containing protein [Gaiellaceae bacterium]